MNKDSQRALWNKRKDKYGPSAMVLIVFVIGAIVYLHHRSQLQQLSGVLEQNNTITAVQLGDVFSVNLPCTSKPTSYSNDSILVNYVASCSVDDKNFVPQYRYSATSNRFLSDKYSPNDDYNFCTQNKTATTGSGIMRNILDPHQDEINGITFSECGFSTTESGLYEVRAVAVNGNSNAAVDVSYAGNGTPDISKLWSLLSNVLQTLKFK